ncbi:hypothetical protein OsccyDRAFT_2690 [Leptolyngbyaceae cyanobacterium JSC-12]|nr:hypothetical protein OsccyDRAFT_2690 [Leptolyngbyaceae cyanobacterium JSC-12]
MRINDRWVRRSLAPIAMGVMISACTAPETTQPVNTSVSADPAIEQTRSQPTAIAPASPLPAIATMQTESRMAGFSTDGKYYLHLESWRDTGAGIPHAAMQVVDLPANKCLEQGCVRTRWSESQANLSTEAAEKLLLQQTQTLRQNLKLTPPTAGTSLPVTARSRAKDGTETVTVRLANGQPLQLKLHQKQRIVKLDGGAEKDQAAMQLEVTYAGKTRAIGSITQMQDWMLKFAIQDVQQSPDGKTVAVLITGAERAFEGSLGRTLVHGFEL